MISAKHWTMFECINDYEDDCACATCQFMREEDEYFAQLRFESECRTIQSVSGKQESREAGWGDGETASAWE